MPETVQHQQLSLQHSMSGEPPLQHCRTLSALDPMVRLALACCSLLVSTSACLSLHSSQAEPVALPLSNRGALWGRWKIGPSSCHLRLEAFPALMPDPRCSLEVFVALRCFSLAEHQSLAGINRAPSPAWRNPTRGRSETLGQPRS